MSSPLDVIRAQALALQAGVDALLLTLDQMQARPVDAPEVPSAAPERPATAPAADGATPASPAPASAPMRFQTFEGPVTVPAPPSSGTVEYRTVAPDQAGDLRPT